RRWGGVSGLLAGGFLGGLGRGAGRRSDVALGHFGDLLGGLAHVVESRVGSGNGALDSGDGNVGTGRGGLGGLFEHAGNIFLEVAELGFDHLGQLFLGLGGNFIDRLRVGNNLVDVRLGNGRLDGDGFLHVLGAEQGLGVGGSFFQYGAGSVEVQIGDPLGRSQGGIGDGKQGLDSGLVGGDELFSIDRHWTLLGRN